MGKYIDSIIYESPAQPHFIILYGPDGVGKTTFAAQFPKPIFIGNETGLASPDLRRVPKFPPAKDLSDIQGALQDLLTLSTTTPSPKFETLVLDSLDWLEILIHEKICAQEGVQNIDQAFGGYGKGHSEVFKVWTKIRPYFEALRNEKKMNIVLIAHAQVKTFNNPFTNSSYDRYSIKLHEKSAAYLREAADCVLFANYKVATQGKENAKHKAFGDGSRMIYTQWRPAFDAKNRLGLEYSFPFTYADFQRQCERKSPEKKQIFLTQIQEMLGYLADPELTLKVEAKVKEAGENLTILADIVDRLREISEERNKVNNSV